MGCAYTRILVDDHDYELHRLEEDRMVNVVGFVPLCGSLCSEIDTAFSGKKNCTN
jgi:hypothetical protein